jgi:thiamine biosynthesis lipoprotein
MGSLRSRSKACIQYSTTTTTGANPDFPPTNAAGYPVFKPADPADSTDPTYTANAADQHLQQYEDGRFVMEYCEFRAMNTSIQLAVDADSAQVEIGFQAARDFIEACERRFTRFSDDSELSGLNRAAGGWFRASPDLIELVSMAQKFHNQTRGLFDPAILTDLRRVGYDKSMDEIRLAGRIAGVNPRYETPREGFLDGRERPVFQLVKIDPDQGRIWMPPEMQLDLGGIAKGWIAERAAAILSEYSSTCAVNAGGDMFLVGLPAEQEAWEIGLEDPRHPDQDLATLKIKPGALATSYITKRTWVQNNSVRHHLIDPRTGRPAETEWLSMTVIAPHAATAEVYAKALLIAGKQDIQSIANNSAEIIFIGVDQEGKLWGSQTSKEVIYAQ